MGFDWLRRGFGAVVLGSAACLFALPATAFAEEGPEPVIANDCAATLQGAKGTPLTVDPGAAVERPGVVTVGLGTDSDGTNGQQRPMLTLPAADAANELGVTSVPVLSDAAGGVCRGAKPVVNAAGAAVQNIVPVDDSAEPPQAPQEPEQPPVDDAPPAERPPQDDPPASATAPDETVPESGGFGGFGAVSGIDVEELAEVFGDGFGSLGTITLPPAAAVGPPVKAPDLSTPKPGEQGAEQRWQESGTAQAVPSGGQQDRVPLLLAVIALAVVATLLGRTFYRRSSL